MIYTKYCLSQTGSRLIEARQMSSFPEYLRFTSMITSSNLSQRLSAMLLFLRPVERLRHGLPSFHTLDIVHLSFLFRL